MLRAMSHSYYKNPRGRMIKMFIMFGSLCFSAYMLPRTIDKLDNAGLGSLIPGAGEVDAEAAKLLGQGGLEGVLNAEQAATKKSSGPIIISAGGVSNGAEYERLKQQANVMAPIKIVKGKPNQPTEGTPTEQPLAAEDAMPNLADIDTDGAVEQLMELLEEAKKGG